MPLYTCPCCGYKTIKSGKPPGTNETCEICHWIDDEYQFNNPNYEGANETSLRHGQQLFIRIGACNEKFVDDVRKPYINDVKDANWKPLPMYTCPCCGFKTLDEEERGSWDICEICFWEDNSLQNDDPDYWGGANDVSLREAQQNFMNIGASEERVLEHVRKPLPTDEKDENWKPLPPKFDDQ